MQANANAMEKQQNQSIARHNAPAMKSSNRSISQATSHMVECKEKFFKMWVSIDFWPSKIV